MNNRADVNRDGKLEALKGLTLRRECEANLYINGEYNGLTDRLEILERCKKYLN